MRPLAAILSADVKGYRRLMRNDDVAADGKMEFRIGIDPGDIIVEDERICGDGVTIAAGLEVMAGPGGICISRTAYDQIEDKWTLGYEYLGKKTVKNIPRPIRAYKVKLPVLKGGASLNPAFKVKACREANRSSLSRKV